MSDISTWLEGAKARSVLMCEAYRLELGRLCWGESSRCSVGIAGPAASTSPAFMPPLCNRSMTPFLDLAEDRNRG